MKINASIGRKLRYGGVSAALTALIIAAVIIANVIFSVLTRSFMLYSDLTPPLTFTLSEECIKLIGEGDGSDSESPIDMVKKFREENKAYNAANGLKKGDEGYRDEELTLNIIFCDEPDAWEGNLMQRYVSHTARELEAEFSEYVNISYVDTVRNPSAVSKYKENSLSLIYDDTVIVECGSEFRTRRVSGFYTYDSATSTEPWAYSGEKAFAADIIAVTRTEAPVACIEVGHGVSYDDYQMLQTLADAGYDIQELRLATDEIPENCRLIIIMNPKNDFTTGDDGISDIDEIGKLEKALENGTSLMVFMHPETPRLEEFEGFLEEWGIVFDRSENGASHIVKDKTQSLTTDGYTIISEYAKENRHSGIFRDLTSRPAPPSIVFKNAMSISYAPSFDVKTAYMNEDDQSTAYKYATKTVDGITTSVYDVFTSSENAEVWANGVAVPTTAPHKLMTVSSRTVITSEGYFTGVSDHTYIFACGSTDFASLEMLQKNSYGNNDALLSIFRTVGKEIVPIGLDPKAFSDTSIDIITTSQATQYTVVLTAVPAVITLVAGIVVLVRRKNR